MKEQYGFDEGSIGIGIEDLYRGKDGDLHLKPDVCLHSEPPYLEGCWGCFWFDGDSGECGNRKVME